LQKHQLRHHAAPAEGLNFALMLALDTDSLMK